MVSAGASSYGIQSVSDERIIVKMDFESEFYRFFWLVPLPFLLAYILVESGVRLKKGWKRAVLLLAVGGLVLFWNRLRSGSLPPFPFRRMFIRWKMIFWRSAS